MPSEIIVRIVIVCRLLRTSETRELNILRHVMRKRQNGQV